ncbi:MAG: hypothetical protein JNK05_40740 [Myxococcales bacterium]|nr:hypothetical protein [Myxococcales bacterium]
MTTFHGLFGETHFVLEVPEYTALVPATVVMALVGAATLVKTRSVARAISIAAAVAFSLVAYGSTRGVLSLFGVRRTGCALSMFPAVFAALAALAAVSGMTFVLASGAAIDRLVRRARPAEYFVAVAALGLSLCGGAFVLRMRAALGPPMDVMPQLLGDREARVQVGASTRMVAFLGWPARRGWLLGTPERALDERERARFRADCNDCVREITGVSLERISVVFRARLGPFALHRTAAYNVEDSRGDARWPLRVGERWTFRERLESTTREGGWAVAMVGGLSHLAPRTQSSNHMSERRRELRVERSFVEGGIRFWELHYEDAGDDRTMLVYGHNGLTWVVGDRRDPWQSRELLIEGAPPRDPRLRVVGAGVFSCRIRGLDFTHCGDGSNPRIPFGPVRGGARDSSGQGLFIAAITLGALVPGAGPRWAYCLEQHTEGTGVEMPVSRRIVAPLASNDPRGERFALCSPPPSAPSERTAQPRPSRRTRPRAPAARTGAGVWLYE